MRNSGFLAALILATLVSGAPLPALAAIDVGVSLNISVPPPVAIAPPPLPVYVVPEPPMVGYIWTPGYWYWGGAGYFWVPGTWVQPPVVGVLWTPGYWGWSGGSFMWHAGYWGPHVGFYGGVNYGGGYNGAGFVGGRWNGGAYVVERNVINAPIVAVSASFNGGPGGVVASATAEQMAFAHENHMPPTSMQVQHINSAGQNPQLAASFNHGKPSIAATARAGDFTHGVIAAREAGARNVEAEQHNVAIKKNPALAKGAALPRANGVHANNAGQHAPQGAQHAPQGAEARPPQQQPHHVNAPRDEEARPEARPAHEEGGDEPRRDSPEQDDRR